MEIVMELDRIVKLAKVVFNEESLGVTYNEMLILNSVDKGYKNLKEISEYLLINKSHVHRTIGRLIEMGYLSKTGGKHYLRFEVTGEGRRVIDNALDVLRIVSEEDLRGIEKLGVLFKDLIREHNERLAKIYY